MTIKPEKTSDSSGESSSKKKEEPRIRCFLDIDIDGSRVGRIVFELFNDVCPITCENFRALCTGEKGLGKTTQKPLHYQGVIFHRIVKDFVIQAGDFVSGDGSSGESIYGGTFEDENFVIKHDKPFLLSMASRGKNTNGSQFFITTQPSPHLDGVHVVFGHVINGEDIVKKIECLPTDSSHIPLKEVKISDCGQLIRLYKKKAKDHKKRRLEASSSSSSEDEGSKKKKRDKKKKHRKVPKKSKEKSDDDEKSDEATKQHPLVTVTKIDPEEIPDVPENKFLMRTQPQEDPGQELNERKDKERSKYRGYTRSGRKIKGRGFLRYRTPSRSRSRSFTPPHWKQAQNRTIKMSDFQKMKEEEERREERRKKREEQKQKDEEERKKKEEERKKRQVEKELERMKKKEEEIERRRKERELRHKRREEEEEAKKKKRHSSRSSSSETEKRSVAGRKSHSKSPAKSDGIPDDIEEGEIPQPNNEALQPELTKLPLLAYELSPNCEEKGAAPNIENKEPVDETPNSPPVDLSNACNEISSQELPGITDTQKSDKDAHELEPKPDHGAPNTEDKESDEPAKDSGAHSQRSPRRDHSKRHSSPRKEHSSHRRESASRRRKRSVTSSRSRSRSHSPSRNRSRRDSNRRRHRSRSRSSHRHHRYSSKQKYSHFRRR